MYRAALNKLLYDLETISTINKGQKIDTTEEYLGVERSNIFQAITRTLSGDSRKKTVSVIRSTIESSIAISDLILESRYLAGSDQPTDDVLYRERVDDLKNIVRGFNKAQWGLLSLCETYSDDSNCVANIKKIIQYMITQSARITKWLLEREDSKNLVNELTLHH